MSENESDIEVTEQLIALKDNYNDLFSDSMTTILYEFHKLEVNATELKINPAVASHYLLYEILKDISECLNNVAIREVPFRELLETLENIYNNEKAKKDHD